jgi:hypothetical protein
MKRYTLNIDRKVIIWVNEDIDVDFEGTEEELRELIEKHEGNIHAASELQDMVYLDSEYVVETEEHMSKEANQGFPTYEIQSLIED